MGGGSLIPRPLISGPLAPRSGERVRERGPARSRAYPQVPSAFGTPHSYFGQQVAGSVATIFAHAHAGAAQTLGAPVEVFVVARSQTGHV